MLTNGITTVEHAGHPLAPRHNKTSPSSRRLSTNHSQVSVDNNGDAAGNSTTRDLLSPSYRASTGDAPYHHDDQFSNADSGIRSGSYYEKASMADSAIVGVSDYDDRESTPESGIRLVPPQPERVRNSSKSSVSSRYPPVTSQSSSSLQRVQNSISPSVTMASFSHNNSPRCHRLSVPSYLSHHSLAWEAPCKSTVIVVTHTGKEVGSHSAKSSRTGISQCQELTPGSSVQLVSAKAAADDTFEGTNNATSDDNNSSSNGDDDDSDDNVSRCVTIGWPRSWKRRIIYPFIFPLVILLYFTLPNVNKPVSNYIVMLILFVIFTFSFGDFYFHGPFLAVLFG